MSHSDCLVGTPGVDALRARARVGVVFTIKTIPISAQDLLMSVLLTHRIGTLSVVAGYLPKAGM